MSAEKFDVLIIGGGNAGIGVTGPGRRAGLSVAMIESRDLGGTCPNRGCTPKKVLVAAGQALPTSSRCSATPELHSALLSTQQPTGISESRGFARW
jgi:glutathione reductase (NADPH)